MRLCSFDGPKDGAVVATVDIALYEENSRGAWDEVALGQANTERTALLVAQTLWDEWKEVSPRKFLKPDMRLQLKVGDKYLRAYTERPE